MAKKTVRRKSSSRSKGMFSSNKKISIAVIAGLIPGMQPSLGYALRGDFATAGKNVLVRYTGWDLYQGGEWNTAMLKTGLYPLLGGMAAHYAANYFGINRMLNRFKLPVEI